MFCADLPFIVIATKHISSRSISISSVPRSSSFPQGFSLHRTMLGPCRPTGNFIRESFAISSTFGRVSRVILPVVREVEARTDVESSLCVRAEVLDHAIDELLALQLHLERLSRVWHYEGVRRARLSQVSRRDLSPFRVKRVRRTGPGGGLSHRGRTERQGSRVQRWRSSRTRLSLRRRLH